MYYSVGWYPLKGSTAVTTNEHVKQQYGHLSCSCTHAYYIDIESDCNAYDDTVGVDIVD